MNNEKPVTEKQIMKKKLRNNLIELVIGLGLLGMCYVYIQDHPAEKVSFFSGYKVIYQQTDIFFQNLFGHNGEWLKQKYTLESYYQVMITQAEEKPCVDPDVVRDLHKTYTALQNEPKNTLEYKLHYYIEKQYKFDEELRKDCPIKDEESDSSVVAEEIPSETENI